MAPRRRQSQKALELELRHCREQVKNITRCFDVCRLITATLDLDEVLEHIMTTSRDVMGADACSLMLVDEETEELVFRIAQGSVGDQLKGGFRLRKGQGIAGHVFATGEPLLVEDAYQDHRFDPEIDKKTGYRTRSILCVPLQLKDRLIGVSQVINRRDGTPFATEDLKTFTLLCAHAAIALENARNHQALLRKQQIERDLALATIVQQSFLPQKVPEIQGFRFYAHYHAALEVGGDFYDFIPLPGKRLGILIGDVSGKGISSALYMARLTSDFRLLASHHRGAARVMERINDLLAERSPRGMFVTLLYMVLDTSKNTISYVNAGHLPPILWNQAKRRLRVFEEKAGPPLGIRPGQSYRPGSICLKPEDCLLLVTDGLIEAKDASGHFLGWERLKRAVRGGDSHAEGVYTRVLESLGRFVRESPQSDDITMVVLGVEAR